MDTSYRFGFITCDHNPRNQNSLTPFWTIWPQPFNPWYDLEDWEWNAIVRYPDRVPWNIARQELRMRTLKYNSVHHAARWTPREANRSSASQHTYGWSSSFERTQERLPSWKYSYAHETLCIVIFIDSL